MRLNARLVGNISMPLAVTIGIGMPPQLHTLIIDTGSDLTWMQRKLFSDMTRQREALFNTAKSSSFAFIPCNSRLCTEDDPDSKICSNKTCRYDYLYVGVETVDALASEALTFGEQDQQVSLSSGSSYGVLIDGNILGASGILVLSPAVLSMVSQLTIPIFSYYLMPYADRKSNPLFFGAMADLRRYKMTGPI